MTVILGGGLSGLSAAYYLTKLPQKQPVHLIEASNRLGGWIKSNIINKNVLFEEGPRTIRPHQNTLQLIQDLNLTDDITPIYKSAPAARNRMIYAQGKLHLLPNSLSGLIKRVSPFSKPILMHLIKDLYTKKRTVKDESVYEFVNRRFGTEVADYLISPIICGICAGNSKEISVNFLMKSLFEYEQKYGNIYKGLLYNLINKNSNNNNKDAVDLYTKSIVDKWSVFSFKNGIETLTEALYQQISNKVSINLNHNCKKIDFINTNCNKVVVHFDNNQLIESNVLISGISAENLSNLLKSDHPTLSNLLNTIKCVNVAVINLYYKTNVLPSEGFGFLVPPKEKLPILGVIFDTCCYPAYKTNDNDNTVLTVMMGGAWFDSIFGSNPTKQFIYETAMDSLKKTMGIKEEPSVYRVNVLNKCIPQYVVGHNETVCKINDYIRANELPLVLCGASYYGVGVNDVILSAKNAVDSVQKLL